MNRAQVHQQRLWKGPYLHAVFSQWQLKHLEPAVAALRNTPVVLAQIV